MGKQITRVKTVTRTFRLDEKLHGMLEEEAEREKISVNSLLSKILWNYHNRCHYCLHYDLLLVEPVIFKTMLENMTEEAIEKFSSAQGPSIVKENISRLGMSVSRESIEFIVAETLGHWTKWYDADVNQTAHGRTYYLHHMLGEKWSLFLKYFFKQAIAELLDLQVTIQTTENSITFALPTPAKPI